MPRAQNDDLTEAKLRRWLTLLRQPDRMAGPEVKALLEAHGRLPDNGSAIAIGRAAAEVLTEAIENLAPPEGASREERLPYLVLRTCFVDGAKLWQAANKLSISERQMTRERTRAIGLLKAELEAGAQEAPPADLELDLDLDLEYRGEPIPAILGFMPRPAPTRALRKALEQHRLVGVHGPPGVGKSSLVAEIASELSETASVLWYRVRPGVNDSMAAFLFDLGDYVRARGQPELAQYMATALPNPEPALATRLALKGLDGSAHLIVLDDYHVVEEDEAINGLIEEAVARLPELRAITISRHRDPGGRIGATYAVKPLTRAETKALLSHLGVEVRPQLADALHSWTGGISQLVKLAAAWLKTATPEEVADVTGSLEGLEGVQAFLLENITELIGPDDQAILHAASTFRDRFTDDGLAFVAQRTRGEVQDASLRLVRSYVATRSRSGDVAFFHHSVRDYVYARLSPKRRVDLHDRAALWYERREQKSEANWHRNQVERAEDEASGLFPPD